MVIDICVSFRFLVLPNTALALLIRFDIQYAVCLLFKNGCLRMNSILKLYWSYSIQAWNMTCNYHRTVPHSPTHQLQSLPVVAGPVSKGSSPWLFNENIQNPRLQPTHLCQNPRKQQIPPAPKTGLKHTVRMFASFRNNQNVPMTVCLDTGGDTPIISK
jgi:hypothetical protein